MADVRPERPAPMTVTLKDGSMLAMSVVQVVSYQGDSCDTFTSVKDLVV
jgi:hypothetical protein